MTLLRQGVLGLALLVAVALLVRASLLDRQLAAAQTEAARAALDRSQAALAQARRALAAERQAQAALRRSNDELARLAARRQRLLKELTHENSELAQWAQRPLPELARRLLDRPALTGAGAYRGWLSDRDALHVEREPTGEQR